MIVYRLEDADGWGVYSRKHKRAGFAECGHCEKAHAVFTDRRYGAQSIEELRSNFYLEEWEGFKADPTLQLAVYEVPEGDVLHAEPNYLTHKGVRLVQPAQTAFKPEAARCLYRVPVARAEEATK